MNANNDGQVVDTDRNMIDDIDTTFNNSDEFLQTLQEDDTIADGNILLFPNIENNVISNPDENDDTITWPNGTESKGFTKRAGSGI